MKHLLRQKVRKTIRNAMFVRAHVEAVHGGLATVRIGNVKGPRLTNLPVDGDEVSVGQQAMVSYTSGQQPVVLPILEAPIEELTTEPSVMSKKPPETEDNDVSCWANQDWWPLETQYNEDNGILHTFKFGGNGWAIPGYTGWDIYPYPDPINWEYDNADFVNKAPYYVEYLTVPMDGKYLVTVSMNPYIIQDGEAATFEMHLRKNGTIFAEYCGVGGHADDDQGIHFYAFDEFAQGDRVALTYYWDVDWHEWIGTTSDPNTTWYNSGNWWFKQWVTMNLWPGTRIYRHSENYYSYAPNPNAKAMTLWNGSGNDSPPANWNTIDYDDSSWSDAVQLTGFSYTRIPGAEAIGYSQYSQSSSEQTLLRYKITMSNPREATLTLDYDDILYGWYVNGNLVHGPDLVGEPGAGDPLGPFTYDVTSYLVSGDNVLSYWTQEAGAGGRQFFAFRLDVTET